MENKAVILNKFESLERCINRINEEFQNDSNNLNNITKADAIMLNLQRACQLVMDTANYVVASRNLGITQSNKDAIEILFKNNLISKEMLDNMKGMIGFRNIAVHDYQEIDEEILIDVLVNHLQDLQEFIRQMLNLE